MLSKRQPEEIAGVASVNCTDMRTLVTGSTSGIGREAALALGRLGANVIVHGRDQAAGEKVVDAITEMGTTAQFVGADFTDVESVRELAATIREETDGLDLLINNAGGFFRRGQHTRLGIERTFHVNHLSSYLLTAELLDHLYQDARIVVTSSAAHQGVSLDLKRVRQTHPYSPLWAYSHSKLANVLFILELAKRFDAADRPITANSLHPGAIPGSGFSRFLPGPLPQVVQQFEAVPGVTSVADGAAEILYVALSKQTAGVSGLYFANQRQTTPSAAAQDLDAARHLWRQSAEFLDIEEPLAGYGERASANDAR